MAVPRDDLLLMTRALKRGIADVKAIRRALDRQVSKPISFLESLHLSATDAEALTADTSLPDPVKDRPVLDDLQKTLTQGEYVSASEWEKFLASLTRTARHGYEGVQVPGEFDGYTLQWELARRERGVVYRAKDAEGRDVAIKIFRADVPVEGDLPKVGSLRYAAGPFQDGETLENRKVSLRRSVETIQKAADQLRGRTHGALTPARIAVRKDDSVAILGSEYAKAVPLSTRAQAYAGGDDVHALGAIMYEILVGSPPAGETSPAARNKDVEPPLDRIVSGALSGAYASTSEFADDLGRYLRGEPVTARKAPVAAAEGRKPWFWIAAASVPVAAAIVWLALPSDVEEPEVKKTVPAALERPKPAPAVSKGEREPRPEKPKPRVVSRKPLTEAEEQKLRRICEASFPDDIDAVIAAADEAHARGSKDDWPLYYLAHAHTERDELDLALEYISRAMGRSPGNEDYLRMRAETYAYRAEVRKTMADLETLFGKDHAAINREILALSKQIKADPGDARARLLRGVFYYLKRHFEPAADDFTAALDAGRRRALFWRARAALGAEDRPAAKRDVKTYLKEFPSDFASGEAKKFLAELR